MKQIATVIPGILNNLPTDERLAGFQWQENRLSETKLIDAKGNPYPIRVVTCYTNKLGGQKLMFHLTVLSSALGLHSTERDCKPCLIGILSLEEDQDYIGRLEQLIDALQHCFIYDDDNVRDEEATHMMYLFSEMKTAPSGNPMGELAIRLGLKVSDPVHIGYVGELKQLPQQLMNAIRWRTLGAGKIPSMKKPKDDIQSYAAGVAEIHENCLVLGAHHSLTWDHDDKQWELIIGSTDDMPRAAFKCDDMGQIFTEALTFLYEHVEKKYAEEA